MRRYALLIFIMVFTVATGWLIFDGKKVESQDDRLTSGEVTLRIKGVERKNQRVNLLASKVMVTTFMTDLGVVPGDVVIVRGKIEPVNAMDNRGYANYLKSRGILYIIKGTSAEVIDHEKNISSVFYKIRQSLGYRMDGIFRQDSSLVKALLYGDRQEITSETKEVFSKTGISHIIAISGFHIGIIATGVFWLLQNISARIRYGVALGIVFFFVFLTGARPSALRAGLFYLILLGGIFMRKEFDIISSALVVGSVFLAGNPYLIYDRGFTLSFMAVLSIGMSHPMLRKIWRKYKTSFGKSKILDWIAEGVMITIAAQILTLPLTTYYFGRISLISPIANLLSVPLITILYPLFFATFCLWWIPGVGEGLRGLSILGIRVFTALNQFLAGLPLAYVETKEQSFFVMVGIYLAIFCLYQCYLIVELKENENHATGFELPVSSGESPGFVDFRGGASSE